MNFELSEYHQHISDDELIMDLIKVANQLGKNGITQKEYQANGKFAYTTFCQHFGTWNKALEKANLTPVFVKNRSKFPVNSVADSELIENLKDVATSLGIATLTCTEYDKHGRFNRDYFKRFGSWEQALVKAGLQPTGYRKNIATEELFSELERVWIELGRQPSYREMGERSKFSTRTYSDRFGGWRNSLQAFIYHINNYDELLEKTNAMEILEEADDKIIVVQPTIYKMHTEYHHKTRRDINLRLRFLVMQRDNFKCCVCGASPSKNPSVELHIDHIVPWSKGGETEVNNLQTLCSKCNLGKSDLNM